jgi:hypothetical protein
MDEMTGLSEGLDYLASILSLASSLYDIDRIEGSPSSSFVRAFSFNSFSSLGLAFDMKGTQKMYIA